MFKINKKEIEVDGKKITLEVAAGIYIYHVQSKINEKYSLGKFAIVK